jgi:hypothetical protein
LQRISNYIIQNPRKWSEDKFYKWRSVSFDWWLCYLVQNIT